MSHQYSYVLCFSSLPTHLINNQERELGFGDFEENMFKGGWRLNTYKLISFKLGVMIEMAIQFDTSLIDLEKAGTCAVILL